MSDPLAAQFALTANPLDDSDWLAVRRAAHRPRRRRCAAAAAVAFAAVLIAAPAFGLTHRLAELIQGSPAPPSVQQTFALDNTMRERLLEEAPAATEALKDRYSPTIAAEARGVAAIQSADGPVYLWAAPTEDGRQCWLIQAGADPSDNRPYGYGACDGLTHGVLAPDGFWTIERPSVKIVHVRVYDDAIATLDVDVEGGETVSLPVASGHALGTVAKDAKITAYVALDAAGERVAQVDAPG
jgi:hypothetical protein